MAWAKAQGWDVYQVYEDPGFSGATDERPAFFQLREDAHQHRFDVVAVSKLDRFMRNARLMLNAIEELNNHKVAFAAVQEGINTAERGTGRLILTILAAIAEWERDRIRERTEEGRLQKARHGKVVSGAAAPFGYRFDPAPSALVVDEEESQVVRLMFYLYQEEPLSLIKLVDRLNKLGIRPPGGGQRWRMGQLGQMLRNETYAGTLWQNRWRTVSKTKAADGEKASSRRRREDWIPVAVPAIIHRDVFEAAQRRLEENRRMATRNTRHEYLLAGILRHACGGRMGGRTHRNRLVYRCYNSQGWKAPINERGEPQPCRCSWVSGTALETAVWDTLTGLLRHPELLVEEVQRLEHSSSATSQSLKTELAQVRKRLVELPQEEARLVNGYRRGLYPEVLMQVEMARLNAERAAVEERLQKVKEELDRPEWAATYVDQVKALARRLNVGLESMAFEQRRELVRLLVNEVLYDDGQLTIKTILPLDQLHPVERGLE